MKTKRKGVGSGNHTNQRRGERHPKAKLTWERVMQMRMTVFSGDDCTIADMARAEGVTTSVAWKAVHGHTWKEVEA